MFVELSHQGCFDQLVHFTSHVIKFRPPIGLKNKNRERLLSVSKIALLAADWGESLVKNQNQQTKPTAEDESFD